MNAELLLPIGLAFIMFCVGLGLRLDDFHQIFKAPESFMVGLINQILLLPLAALLIVFFFDLTPVFSIGIMILAACPGGVTSNFITVLAAGNAALSVSMTAVTSMLSIITVPAILWTSHLVLFKTKTAISMPVDQIVIGIALVTGLPLILGMALTRFLPALSQKMIAPTRSIATLIFATLVAASFFMNKDNITTYFVDIGLLIILLNVITLLVGYMSARSMGFNAQNCLTISIESGLQNVALALFLSNNVFDAPMMMIPAIIYALIMNLSAAFMIFKGRQLSAKQSAT